MKIFNKYSIFVALSICLLLGVSGNTKDADAAFKLCVDISDHCSSTSAFNLGLCAGYLEGVVDSDIEGACIPEKTNQKKLRNYF